MDKIKSRALQRAVVTVASAAQTTNLTPEDQATLASALDELDAFSGRAVAQAFLEWRRRGSVTRTPLTPPLHTYTEPEPVRPRFGRAMLNLKGPTA